MTLTYTFTLINLSNFFHKNVFGCRLTCLAISHRSWRDLKQFVREINLSERTVAFFLIFASIFHKMQKYATEYQFPEKNYLVAYFCLLWKNEAKIEKNAMEAFERLISRTNCFKSRQNRWKIARQVNRQPNTFIWKKLLRFIKVKV